MTNAINITREREKSTSIIKYTNKIKKHIT